MRNLTDKVEKARLENKREREQTAKFKDDAANWKIRYDQLRV